jgi:alpha-beta hydrolase superfamily lysophospholipase
MWRRIAIVLGVLAAIIVAPIVIGAKRTYAPLLAAAPGDDVRTKSVTRQDVRFPCGQAQCAAWLYLPYSSAKPPIIVMAHGFAGTRDVALPFVAETFASHGLAALVFDYRYFGASGGAPRQLIDVTAQLEDWSSAIDFASAHKDVDGTRLGVWGSSMGGGHALIAAAKSDKVSVAVAQAPLVDSTLDGDAAAMSAAETLRLLASAWGGLWVSAFGFDPWTIPAIAREGEFAMLSDDAAFAAFSNLVGPESLYRNAVVAHSVFLFDDYNPAVQAANLKKPTLLIASRSDRFAPFKAAEVFAAKSETRTIREVNCDHFAIYDEPCRGEAASQAANFFSTHLAAAPLQ